MARAGRAIRLPWPAVTWKGQSLDELRDRPIRLKFFIQNCDLYSFRATGR